MWLSVAGLLGVIFVGLYLNLMESEIYLQNGAEVPLRVVEIRLDGRSIGIRNPVDYDFGRTGFYSLPTRLPNTGRRLEILTSLYPPGISTWSCDLEGGRIGCFYRVFFTKNGLNCHPCDRFPDVF